MSTTVSQPDPDLAGGRGLGPRTRPVHQRDELLGGQHAVALGEQLGDLVPVGGVLEHHPDHVAAPAGVEERMPGVAEHAQLFAGRPERDEGGGPVDLGRAGVRRVAAALDGEHVGEGALADPPAGADPGLLLVGVREAPCRSVAPCGGPSRARRRTPARGEGRTATLTAAVSVDRRGSNAACRSTS